MSVPEPKIPMATCTCRNFGPVEYREVEPRCPLHGWLTNEVAERILADMASGDRWDWPHSHADDPRLNEGTPHSPGDSSGADNLFVRCHDCLGRGCDSCEDTGFDWLDTEQARATIRQVVETSDES